MPLKLNGYTAHICCDGKELEQFDVQQEGERTVTCWIPSESGKEFTVCWGDELAATIMQVLVYVDGRCVLRSGMRPGLPGIRTKFLSNIEERPGFARSIKFANLVLTDDEAVASASAAANEKLAKLGTIEIEMRKVKRYEYREDFYSTGEVPEIGPIHERSKKAGVHAVSLGEVTERVPKLAVRPVGVQNDPFAVFKFRYRPIELLRANGVAPQPPKGKKRTAAAEDPDSGEAGPNDPKRPRRNAEEQEEHEVKSEQGDGEDDNKDRVTFLQEHIAILQTQLAREQAKRSKTVVKREVSPIRIPIDWTNEVIDLT